MGITLLTGAEAKKALKGAKPPQSTITFVGPLGIKIFVAFGVKQTAGIPVRAPFDFTFGVRPDPERPYILLANVKKPKRQIRLAFNRAEAEALLDAHITLLLAADRPEWLGHGDAVNFGMIEKLMDAGWLDIRRGSNG